MQVLRLPHADVDTTRHANQQNQAVADAQQRRAQGRPTVPSTMGKELATNPFLRVGEGAVRAKVEGAEGMGPEGVLGALREMKDAFKG